jgi:hypothetical protein
MKDEKDPCLDEVKANFESTPHSDAGEGAKGDLQGQGSYERNRKGPYAT